MAEVSIVRHHEEPTSRSRPSRAPRLVHEVDDHCIGGARTREADDRCRRDPFAPQATFGRSVEDELDPDPGRDHASEPADERSRRRRAAHP
jgi:hypothetical protein